jgi:phospho-2-dehydro-3-deoxyheptonate aldolase
VFQTDTHPQAENSRSFFEATQIAEGDARIFGVMIESHLKAGR